MRLFGVLRAARGLAALRGARLVRVFASINRGMRALSSVMRRRSFGYAILLSVLVVAAGAAGMYAFEGRVLGSTVTSFTGAVWWTAMILTTMGSDYFPKTSEGRFLCFVLAVYGFAVFGCVTATISSFFVAHDAETDEGEIAGAKQVSKLEQEIAALHQKLDGLTTSLAAVRDRVSR
jgi:voltage-gated potassium channel